MHKIRLLCGSIAVTIATHKNSKIQRLSEFFLMRIGACFATFAILSYTKIIDNNWYLRHLFSYFLLGIQWGNNVFNLNGFTKEVTLPLNINYAAAAVATMRSGDFPGYVACPYWSECTKTSIKITPDYEVGQGYAGTGQAVVTWILLSV